MSSVSNITLRVKQGINAYDFLRQSSSNRPPHPKKWYNSDSVLNIHLIFGEIEAEADSQHTLSATDLKTGLLKTAALLESTLFVC